MKPIDQRSVYSRDGICSSNAGVRSTRRLAAIRGGIAVATACAWLLSPQVSQAQVGALTAESCTQNTGGVACAGSGGTAPGLNGTIALALSPNGTNLYAASLESSAVALFARGPLGSLSSAGCVQNAGGTTCTGVGGTAKGLDGAIDVATSPDGKSVYVVSDTSDTIVTFDRAVNGTLTSTGCISDSSESALCASTGGNTPGLLSPSAVAVSPDGMNVYVVSYLGNAVATFNRAADGTLTAAGCIQNTGGINCSGSGGTTPGLDGAYDVTVSPDGKNVYVASYTSSAVVTFARGPGGALTPDGCVQNTGGTACAGNNAPGLSGPRSIAVSPDGDNLYVAGYSSDAIAVFERALDGELTAAGCIQNSGGTQCTAVEDTTPGLDGPSSVVVSPDGTNVYVASTVSDAVATFTRAIDGSLTPGKCIQDTGRTECSTAGGSTAPGLDGAIDVAMSPGGTSVYVASYNGDSIAVFSREGFPATTTTTNTTTTSTTTTLEPSTTTTLPPDSTTTTTAGPLPDCGDWNDNGDVSATDALAILKASVGGNQCDALPCVCNVAGGGSVVASDALAALRIAVGLPVVPACNC